MSAPLKNRIAIRVSKTYVHKGEAKTAFHAALQAIEAYQRELDATKD